MEVDKDVEVLSWCDMTSDSHRGYIRRYNVGAVVNPGGGWGGGQGKLPT